MADITLKDIRKSYGRTEVIHGIDAHIDDGEFIVIVGPSGCGKSTLLRMVAGLETISSGEVSIGDRVVNDLEPRERDIAMVFQNYALYPHMSVFDNMAYGLKIANVPKDEILARVTEAARMLELEPYLDRKPRQLSGGQRQRVAMGRAIVRKPAVFLFDEPLSNLDAKLRVQMRLEIKSLQRKLGVTAMYVTHDQVEAMTLADRMIVMNAGVAEQVGAPLEVYANPQTLFVAGFIGSPPMNVLKTEIREGTAVVGSGYEVRGRELAAGSVIGVRPEHIMLTAAGAGLFDATVDFCEPLGAETLVHTSTDAGDNVVVRIDGEAAFPQPGDRVGLQADQSRLLAFDAKGKRIASLAELA